ncbi:MAG: 4-(cytidine 5'-diphospho)-2-C-methyl-D-erythritol kinase [Mariprofundaceae bacterium]
MNAPRSLTLPAPAKVNLFLHVTGRRNDGLHELDTAFAFVDAQDTLHFTPSDAIEVTCSDASLNGEHNLVWRVLTRFSEACGARGRLRVHIDKRLPAQAGLGGGSSDAATALLAANRIWGANWPTERLIAFAAPLGADIPCFLFGHASRARGIGERLSPYPDPIPAQPLLLAWPGEGLATARVFAHHDAHTAVALTPQQGGDTMRAPSRHLGANDLEEDARALSRRLARLLGAMRDASDHAWMSGSGTCCAALCADAAQGRYLAGALRRKGLAAWTHVGRLLARHPLMEIDGGMFIGA